MVSAFPEAIIGSLVAEDLAREMSIHCYCGVEGSLTSMRPTTMDRLGI